MAGPRAPTDDGGAARRRRLFLALAGIWSIGLALVGAFVPLATTRVTTGALRHTGGTVQATASVPATLFTADGAVGLVPVLAPVVAVAAVTALLGLRRRHDEVGAGALAWCLVAALAVVAVAGSVTVGVGVLPVVLLLAVACASRHAGALSGDRWDGGRWG